MELEAYRVNNLKWGKVEANSSFTTYDALNLKLATCGVMPEIYFLCFGLNEMCNISSIEDMTIVIMVSLQQQKK